MKALSIHTYQNIYVRTLSVFPFFYLPVNSAKSQCVSVSNSKPSTIKDNSVVGTVGYINLNCAQTTIIYPNHLFINGVDINTAVLISTASMQTIQLKTQWIGEKTVRIDINALPKELFFVKTNKKQFRFIKY